MNKACEQCGIQFEIADEDLKFYRKVSPVINGKTIEIPIPEMCPKCRMQRRMAFRNQSSLYRRKCDKIGDTIISMYRADAPFPVYKHDQWLNDDWDAKEYGRDYDFDKPFFQQFLELRNQVPHMSLVFQSNINCDYCNIVGNSKNCYLIYGSVECEDCYYGNPYNCKQCIDSFLLRNSEICLECVDSNNLYDCCRCQNCSNSNNLMFCFEVSNSKDCFGCAALNHKQYCIFNKQYSKEEYEKKLLDIDLSDANVFQEVLEKFNEVKRGVAHRFYVGVNNESVSGDYIFNSKDCNNVYGVDDCRDVSYSFQLLKVNDSMDLTVGEYGELNYYVSAFYDRVTSVLFSYFCWSNVHNLMYCGQCTSNVKDCFGCIGLTNSQYCILNKQYSKEEYENLVEKITVHMRSTGEWGKFFPMEVSPFAYNETIASECYPLTREEVLVNNWEWFEESPKESKQGEIASVCEVTGVSFKLIPQEEKMYKHFGLVLPKRSPKQRHLDRIGFRNPMALNNILCESCGVEVKSTYSLDRSERVYCEECYLKEVY